MFRVLELRRYSNVEVLSRTEEGARLVNSNAIEDLQRATCARFGAEYIPAPRHLTVGFSKTIREGLLPINGLRHPTDGTTTGWYLWGGELLSDSPDFFQPLHVEHLGEWCPAVEKYLGLPPGWLFLIAGDYEDVWYDESLLAV